MTLPGFVDVHAHVVPSGDDGAVSVEQGLELCRLAAEAGTRVLFATPHAHASWDTFPRTTARERIFDAAYPVMRAIVAEWGLDLRRGWEVYPSVVDDTDPAELRLAGTSAVLVEFPGWWLDVADPIPLVTAACERIEAAGLVPVLAHPERCPAVAAAPELVAPLAERGWLVCLNAPSLLGEHGATSERAAWKLLEAGVVSLAASDAHGFERPPTLDRAFRAVEQRHGRDRALPLFDGSPLPWSS
jgi:protein-tyrosine phosphatase